MKVKYNYLTSVAKGSKFCNNILNIIQRQTVTQLVTIRICDTSYDCTFVEICCDRDSLLDNFM